MGARFEALVDGVLMAPLDSRYNQVGFNLVSVQVCAPNLTENPTISVVHYWILHEILRLI